MLDVCVIRTLVTDIACTMDLLKEKSHLATPEPFVFIQIEPVPSEENLNAETVAILAQMRELKTRGNDHFKQNRFADAVTSYTSSIELGEAAQDDGCRHELANCYQNRATANCTRNAKM